MAKDDEGFYFGVVHALDVVALYDQGVIAKGIIQELPEADKKRVIEMCKEEALPQTKKMLKMEGIL